MYDGDDPRGLPPAMPEETSSSVQIPSQSVNVLIMNLPFRVRWQDLKDLCRQACAVERADVALEVDGRSRGFGEVTCSTRADADRLYNMFNGYEWQNRRLNVIVLEVQGRGGSDRGPFSQVGPGSGTLLDFRNTTAILRPQLPTDDKLLFVGNLPFSMQWQDLKDLLRPAGRVQRTDISMASDGRSRGWGTALFYTAEEAQKAVDMFNETEAEGRRIKVRLDRLGGRGVPANRQISSVRTGPGPGMGSPMGQQHPGPYPLQQAFPGHASRLLHPNVPHGVQAQIQPYEREPPSRHMPSHDSQRQGQSQPFQLQANQGQYQHEEQPSASRVSGGEHYW